MDNVKQVYDIAIVGGGPAGLTAGLYARRANRSVLILEKATFGGQITFSPKVENIPGFPVLSGNEFAERLVDQVLALGAEMESAGVLGMEPADGGWLIHTDSGDFAGRTVILATGARHRRLGLDREESFIGNGISFCAVCQADIASSIKLDSLCYGILLNLRCHKTVLCIPVFPIDGNFVHIPRFYTFDNKFPIIILFHSHILR